MIKIAINLNYIVETFVNINIIEINYDFWIVLHSSEACFYIPLPYFLFKFVPVFHTKAK